MAKSRNKKKSPKRVLALLDLEQAKSAVLNTLTSKSSQQTYDHAITEFSNGTVQSRAWHSIEPLFLDTGLVSNKDNSPRQPSTCASRLSGGLPTKPPIPGC